MVNSSSSNALSCDQPTVYGTEKTSQASQLTAMDVLGMATWP